MTKSPRVLVAGEDERLAAESGGRLERMGYEVAATVPTLPEAIVAAESGRPDVVLFEVHRAVTPAVSELVQIVVDQSRVPVVVVSGNGSKTEGSLAKIVTSGEASHLVRPVTDHVLAAALERTIVTALRVREREDLLGVFTQVFARVPGPTVIVSRSGQVQALNGAARRLLGAAAAHAPGRPLGEVLRLPSPTPGDPVVEPIERTVVREDGPSMFGTALVDSSGQLRPVQIRRELIPGRRGRPVGAIVEIALGDEPRPIDLDAAARTAPRDVRTPFDPIALLATGVGHQLNNAVQIILGHADLLKEGLAGKKASRVSIETIRKTGRKTATFVRKLVDYVRSRSRNAQFVDLADLVADLVPRLLPVLPADVELRTACQPGHGLIEADPREVEVLLTTLVTNARDAMPRGGTITVRTSSVEIAATALGQRFPGRRGVAVQLSVADTGVGIDPDVRDHLFEPFFTTKPGASGLGLAVAYEIVQRCGGVIDVVSEVGRGSTFSAHLPAVEERAAIGRAAAGAGQAVAAPARHEAAPPPPPEPLVGVEVGGPDEGEAEPVPGGSETILVVEDSASVLDLCATILRSLGYQVLEASRGEEALRVAEAQAGRIDLLLTDVVMPGMDGLRLASRLKEVRPDTRVLYMSGYQSEATRERIAKDPGSGFLEKPFEMDALGRKVRAIIDGQSALGAQPAQPRLP